MNKRKPKISKPKIIADKKQRGEWAESVFMARAHEHGLPVSKPWGEMCPYDFVVGKTGRFVSVQVKSTLSKIATGYVCTVRGGHQAYSAGSFDFLAVYVVPADTWYIIPAKLIQGKERLTLYPNSPTAKYEPYREAWELLREAIRMKKPPAEVAEHEEKDPAQQDPAQEDPNAAEKIPRNAVERMEAAFEFVRRHWGL
jgi:PD-(D/E)XK endonuclease